MVITTNESLQPIQPSSLSRCVPWPDEVAHAYRRAGYWTGETLGGLLARLAASYPERVALIDRHRQSTFAELDARASELGLVLAQRGLRAGDRVLVQMPNRVEWFELCFALWRLGVVPILAHPAHRRLELTHFCRSSAAVAYFTLGDHGGFDYPRLGGELKQTCPTLRDVFTLDELGPRAALPTPRSVGSAQPVVASGGSAPAGPRGSDVALFQLSGASTGMSKLIPRTHDDYLYSVRQSARVCGLDEHSRYLVVLPVAHNFPLSSPGALGTLSEGGTVVLSESPAPEQAFAWIAAQRITITALVPSLASVWLQAAERLKPDFSSLRLLQVGGAKLDPELARRLYRTWSGSLQQVFGMAEGLVCYTRPGAPESRVIHTQGQPMSEADELRIVDEDGRDVPPGSVGELWTRGPYTIRGYYDAAEHNALAFTPDGYYKTGDLVKITPEGDLVVEGRIKDQINRGGEKVGAPEVEQQLKLLDGVLDAAVVAVPDRYLGERSCAFIVLKERAAPPTPSARELRRLLRERGLADYKVPDIVRIVTELPTTPVGKVDKVALRRLALMEQARSASMEV